ncbi:hypothetical protein FS837_009667 [Tulasnella sp. UAMH 9824]|nr:hypothetical protein FS837_009667 [Tulasnella sp. UAMH 9824]
MSALGPDQLKEVAKFGPRGKLPDKKTDAEGWNATWNRYLEWVFHPKQTMDTKVAPDRLAPFFEFCENPLTSQTYFSQSRDVGKNLLQMQIGMTDYIRDQWGSFALGWLSRGSEERSKHILRALVQLCDTFDIEGWRFFCPESTTTFLERDSGRGLLDLITTFFPPSQPDSKIQAKRDKPTLLFHPQVDRALGFDRPCPAGRDPAILGLIRNDIHYVRAEFLCRMVLHIVCDALDVVIPPVQARKLGSGRKESRELLSRFPVSVNSVDGWKKNVLDPLRAMQKKATRDWKFGDPPHKTICGKPVSLPCPNPVTHLRTFDQSMSSSEKDVYAIPPPDKGFIRSNDLVCQIMNLQDKRQEMKGLAYIYVKDGEQASFICLYPDRWTAAYFRVFRNHAFRNGDPKAVAVM